MHPTALAPNVALVTGGTGVVGVGIVRKLLAEGYHIVATYHSGARRAEALTQELDPQGRRLLFVPADFADPAAADDVVERTVQRFGRLDGVVHSAAIVDNTSINDLTVHDFAAVFAVNVTASFLLARTAARQPTLRAVVLLSSIAAEYTGMGSAAYEASKGAVSTLTRTLAAHYAPRVRVNAIAPGVVESHRTAGDPQFSAQALAKRIPMGELAGANDIGEITRFLLGTESGYLTGQVLTVDGGFSVRLT